MLLMVRRISELCVFVLNLILCKTFESYLEEEFHVEPVVPNTFEEIDYMCGYRIQNRFFLAGSKTFALSAQRWELTMTGWVKRPDLDFGFDEGRCIEFDDDRNLRQLFSDFSVSEIVNLLYLLYYEKSAALFAVPKK